MEDSDRDREVFNLALELLEQLRGIPEADASTIVGFENYIEAVLEDIGCAYTTSALFLISLFGQPQGRTGELVVTWLKRLRNSNRQSPTSKMTMVDFTRAMMTFLQSATFTFEVVHSTNVFYIELFHDDPSVPPLRLDRLDLTPLEQLCVSYLLRCVHDDKVPTSPWGALVESQTECRKVTYRSFAHTSLMSPHGATGEFLRANLVFVFVSAFYAGIQQQFSNPGEAMFQTLMTNSFLQTCNDCARAVRHRNEKKAWRVVSVHTNQLVERTRKMRQRASHLTTLAGIMDTVSDAMIASAGGAEGASPEAIAHVGSGAGGDTTLSISEAPEVALARSAGVPASLVATLGEQGGHHHRELDREARVAEREAVRMEHAVQARRGGTGGGGDTSFQEFRLGTTSAEDMREEAVEMSIARAAVVGVTSAIAAAHQHHPPADIPIDADDDEAEDVDADALLARAVRTVCTDAWVRVEGPFVIEHVPKHLFDGALRRIGDVCRGSELFWDESIAQEGVGNLFLREPKPLQLSLVRGHAARVLHAEPRFFCV